ncbi:MAG: beta-ketoacyl synthase N-terminal-like domain-containing protein [Candidatus Bruticola sp.]
MAKQNTDIAVVGIGLNFPGAHNAEEYWRRLQEAQDLSEHPSSNRWPIDDAKHLSPIPKADGLRCTRGYYLHNLPSPEDEGLPNGTDPVFVLSLNTARQAVQNTAIKKERTGVIMAAIALPTDTTVELSENILGSDFAERLRSKLQETYPNTAEFSIQPSFISNGAASSEVRAINASPVGLPAQLIANSLGLGLGGYTLDAACASSLVAIELACEELRSGQAEAMIAGGVSRPDCLYTQMGFSALRALSPSGVCSPFDVKADGLMVGEGCGLVVLKRLADAEAQGDKIYAVIKGTGLSNDIEGSLVAPSSEGQLRSLRQAYEVCKLNPWDIDLIECHGTGTPVGDRIEFNSLQTLWENAPQGSVCQLRSVKSMIGHLLTAAGAAGLIRVLLNMQHKIITPQVNFQRSNLPLADSCFRIENQELPWPQPEGRPRRAAVSGFGFGGINAHIILEEYTAPFPSEARASKTADSCPNLSTANSDKLDAVAVIGLAGHFGSLNSTEKFKDAVFNGLSALEELPDDRWQGIYTPISTQQAYIKDISVTPGQFRVPPADIPHILPQQTLLLYTAAQAMADAKQPLRQRRHRAAAFIGIALDLNSTNFTLRWHLEKKAHELAKLLNLNSEQEEDWLKNLQDEISAPLDATRTMGALGSIAASRAAREFQFGGCSFTVSSQESSGLTALKLGSQALLNRKLDLALVGAIDLQGDVRAAHSHFAELPEGYGEGCCCFVLKRLSDARRDGDHIYCLLKGFGQASETGNHSAQPSSVQLALEQACAQAGTAPEKLSYLEFSNGSLLTEPCYRENLQQIRRTIDKGDIPLSVTSVSSVIGQCGAASALASTLKTALSLEHHILPASPRFIKPLDGEDWTGSRFCVHTKPSFWFRRRADGSRCAAVICTSYPHQTSTIILEEAPVAETASQDQLVDSSASHAHQHTLDKINSVIFASYAETAEQLKQQLKQLQTEAEKLLDQDQCEVDNLIRLGSYWHKQQNQQHKLAMAFVIDLSTEEPWNEFHIRLKLAIKHLEEYADKPLANHSIFYSPNPLAQQGRTAFVYPGSGANFLGLGRELALHFPQLMERFDRENLYMADEFMARWNQPYRLDWSDNWQRDAFKTLASDTHKMMFSQVSFAMLTTDAVRSLGLEPQAAIGYSLGESAALFALRAWPERDLMYKRMEGSDLFREQLSGKCLAARRAWNIPSGAKFEWMAGVIRVPASQVKEAIATISQVRLLIINTDNECVVGGTREAISKLCTKLKTKAIFVSGVDTVHCDCLDPVAQQYWDMHYLPCTPPPGIDFYSGYYHRSYNLTSEKIADSIVAHGRFGFDYTKTIRQAWQDGVRIFLEMGPGASCTRMINNILADKPHFAISLSNRGKSELSSLECLLAGAISQGLRPDLSSLFPKDKQETISVGKRLLKIALGRRPFDPPLCFKLSCQEAQPNEFNNIIRNNAPPILATATKSASCKSSTPQAAQLSLEFASLPNKQPNTEEDASQAIHKPLKAADNLHNNGKITEKAMNHIEHNQLSSVSAVPAEAHLPSLLTNDEVTSSAVQNIDIANSPLENIEKLLLTSAQLSQQSHNKWLDFVKESSKAIADLLQRQSILTQNLACYDLAYQPNQVKALTNQTLHSSLKANDIANQQQCIGHNTDSEVLPDSLKGASLSRIDAPSAASAGRVVSPQTSPGHKATYKTKLHGVEFTASDGYICGNKPSLASANQQVFMDRQACLEFAVGKIGHVLGEKFAPVDNYSTRVRLPAEPLMLVDRIISVEGEPLSLGSGRVITEHDVVPGMWYLDGGRAPVFISVEAGQADLFLCSWLGIDFKAQGKRVYRLLDANVTFHRGLPQPGETIHYDIRIKRFINQGDTWLFFFEYEGTINGQTFLTMRDGCAGFFTHNEIRNNGGLVLTEDSLRPKQGRRDPNMKYLVPLSPGSYSPEQVEALRRGDLEACFGADFAGLPLHQPISLPSGLLRLIHRIPECDPQGGRWGLGKVIAEADVHPEDWYLTCHFVDDMVMPGTLMYECCAHALRFLLTRLGWVGEKNQIAYEPVIGVKAVLKCRGPVLQTTKTVRYQVEIKEIGYNPHPYVIADAIMYADNKRVVGFENISMQLTGTTGAKLEELWSSRQPPAVHLGDPIKKAIFNEEQFMQFAIGKPSLAFGPEFAEFDTKFIARLPGPPYQFVSRIVSADHPFLKTVPGGWVEAQYDIPENAWYFKAGHTGRMPFCVLNEIALQVCGWVSSYAGSSKHSSENLHYRNLGGTSILHEELHPKSGTVTIRVRLTKSSEAGGLIIQDFDMNMSQKGRLIYEGQTTFGFFTEKALADQVGVRGASKRLWYPAQEVPFEKLPVLAPLTPSDNQDNRTASLSLPGKALLMLDEYAWYPQGGKLGLGAAVGRKRIDPQEWFFKAHFFQDPVMPGSLGLEAFIQLLKIIALKKWPNLQKSHTFSAITLDSPHHWLYRGQVTQANQETIVRAEITEIGQGNNPYIKANGILETDGKIIYELKDFSVSLSSL